MHRQIAYTAWICATAGTWLLASACATEDKPPQAELTQSGEDGTDEETDADTDPASELEDSADSGSTAEVLDDAGLVDEPEADTDDDPVDDDPEQDSDDAGLVITEPTCGDGLVNQEAESCDQDNVQGLTCEDVGYSRGVLRCDDDCVLDLSDCEGDEHCFDGRDNDGDSLIDCVDEDCAETCAASCENAVDVREVWEFVLDGPNTISGSTAGHASELDSDCALEPGGPEVAYRYRADKSGVLELHLQSAQLLSLSIVLECSSLAANDAQSDAGTEPTSSELACVPATRTLSQGIESGDELFIVVDGRRPQDEGSYVLSLDERSVECGDGSRDGNEGCDDGNSNSGDGCSDNCELESSEEEPNDDEGDATAFVAPYFASIDASDDVDWVALTLPDDVDYLELTTLSVGDGACSTRQQDTLLELRSESGELLVSDDDGGEGTCSRIVLEDVEAGEYFAVVSAVPSSGATAFPYRLTLLSSICGDGARGIGEQCDDGNRDSGDGCSDACTDE